MRKPVRTLFCLAGLGSTILLGSMGSLAQRDATIQRPATSNLPPLDRNGRESRELDGPNPLGAIQEAQRTKAIANERQKRIIDDTAKLLQLATELKTAVDKTTKDQLSLDVIRKAEEIEKLARDVKQRMKS